MRDEVDRQYKEGRVTAFSEIEIEMLIKRYLPEQWKKVMLNPPKQLRNMRLKFLEENLGGK